MLTRNVSNNTVPLPDNRSSTVVVHTHTRGWTTPESPGHLPGQSRVHAEIISVFAPYNPGHAGLSRAQNNIVILQCLQANNEIFIMINFD